MDKTVKQIMNEAISELTEKLEAEGLIPTEIRVDFSYGQDWSGPKYITGHTTKVETKVA